MAWRSYPLIVVITVFCGLVTGVATTRPVAAADSEAANNSATANSPTSKPTTRARGTQGRSDNDLIALASDAAASHACKRITERFRTLKSEGRDDQPAATGSLWLHDCTAQSVAAKPEQFTLTLSGEGWRWLYREREKLDAEFEVSQMVRFAVDINLTLAVQTYYDPDKRWLAAWFVPTREPQVDFRSVGDVEVDKEGLWASVLAGAASVALQSPDAKADKQFEQKGAKKFRKRFDEGFSLAMDMCTGRTVTELSHMSQQELFTRLGQPPENEPVEVILRPNGLVLSGPYKADAGKLAFEVGPAASSARAELMCYQQATRFARAVIDGKPLPQSRPLAALTLAPDKNASTLTLTSQPDCPVILALHSTGEQAVQTRFKVTSEPGSEGLLNCPS